MFIIGSCISYKSYLIPTEANILDNIYRSNKDLNIIYFYISEKHINEDIMITINGAVYLPLYHGEKWICYGDSKRLFYFLLITKDVEEGIIWINQKPSFCFQTKFNSEKCHEWYVELYENEKGKEIIHSSKISRYGILI